MLATLETRSLAAFRESLRHARAPELASAWNALLNVRGGNEHIEFDAEMRRTVLACVMLRMCECLGCTVGGNFVKSHYSGVAWDRMDVIVHESIAPHLLWTGMVEFVLSCLPLQRWQLRSGGNALQRTLTVAAEGQRLSFAVHFFDAQTVHNCIPVTLGDCLVFAGGATAVRCVDASMREWRADEVVALLRACKDVRVCFDETHMAQWYGEYYWRRIDQLRQTWDLSIEPIGTEPLRLGG